MFWFKYFCYFATFCPVFDYNLPIWFLESNEPRIVSFSSKIVVWWISYNWESLGVVIGSLIFNNVPRSSVGGSWATWSLDTKTLFWVEVGSGDGDWPLGAYKRFLFVVSCFAVYRATSSSALETLVWETFLLKFAPEPLPTVAKGDYEFCNPSFVKFPLLFNPPEFVVYIEKAVLYDWLPFCRPDVVWFATWILSMLPSFGSFLIELTGV